MIIHSHNINRIMKDFDNDTIHNLNEEAYIDQRINEIETGAELKANVSAVKAKNDMLGALLDIKR
jgi:hypothetical protein